MHFPNDPYIRPIEYAQKVTELIQRCVPGKYRIVESRDTGKGGNEVSHQEVARVESPGRFFGYLWPTVVAEIVHDIRTDGVVGGLRIKVYEKKVDPKRLETAVENMRLKIRK